MNDKDPLEKASNDRFGENRRIVTSCSRIPRVNGCEFLPNFLGDKVELTAWRDGTLVNPGRALGMTRGEALEDVDAIISKHDGDLSWLASSKPDDPSGSPDGDGGDAGGAEGS